MSLLGVPDFQAEWFRATPMAPYTHFHEFAFVRRSTYTQRHTIHHTCSLPCNFLPFCELLIRIVSPYQELICSGISGRVSRLSEHEYSQYHASHLTSPS